MYTIIFDDGTTFAGGNPENSLWNQIPDKPIKELTYILKGKTIKLRNFESYNHLIVNAFLMNSQQQYITAIILLACEQGKVKRFIFDLIKNELFTDIVNEGEEFKNKSTTGWKPGILGQIPQIRII